MATTKNVRANILTGVKDWYVKQYPTDTMGQKLHNLSFCDLLSGLQHGEDFYELIGVSDSIIRERIFDKLAKVSHLAYDKIYYLWVNTPTGYLKIG